MLQEEVGQDNLMHPIFHISVRSEEKNWESINPLAVDNEAFRDKSISTRGVQLQNFGKTRYNPYSIMGPNKWEGTVATPKRGAVVQFQDLFHSTRAAIKILNTYSKVGIKKYQSIRRQVCNY